MYNLILLIGNVMPKFMLPLVLLLCCASTPAGAAEPSPQLKRAVDKLVESQNLAQMWPMIIESSSKNGAQQIVLGAREAVDNNADLTAAQRATARAIIEETAPQMVVEIDALHRKIPVKALFTEMGYSVYPKYFTPSEIEEMARFYSGTVFPKLARFHIRAKEESARTGQSADALFSKYSAQLTQSELASMLAFNNSATGRKLQRVGPAFTEEARMYLLSRTSKDVDQVAHKYGLLMREKFQKTLNE
jgi:hypothetical protein